MAVVAISPRDVWAVGAYQGSIPPGVSVAKTLTEHWDGTRWRIIASANSKGSGQLQSIVALSPNDVWAAGGAHSGGENVPDRPLAEHWDGKQWTIKTGAFGAQVGYTRDLAAQSSTSVALDAYDAHDMIVQRWDGHTWDTLRRVPIDSSLVPLRAVALRYGWAVLRARRGASTRPERSPRGVPGLVSPGPKVNGASSVSTIRAGLCIDPAPSEPPGRSHRLRPHHPSAPTPNGWSHRVAQADQHPYRRRSSAQPSTLARSSLESVELLRDPVAGDGQAAFFHVRLRSDLSRRSGSGSPRLREPGSRPRGDRTRSFRTREPSFRRRCFAAASQRRGVPADRRAARPGSGRP